MDILTSKRNQIFVLSLETPLEHTNIGIERERLGGILQRDALFGAEQFLVHVRMRLNLNAAAVSVFHLSQVKIVIQLLF